MPPFEWLTPERAWRAVMVLWIVGLVVIGSLNVYLALVERPVFAVFGVDALLVGGVLQVLAGVILGFYAYWFRLPVPRGETAEVK